MVHPTVPPVWPVLAPTQPLHSMLAAEVALRETRPKLGGLPVAVARQNFRADALVDAASATVDGVIPGSEGALPFRIFDGGGAVSPLIVYFHGGGFVLGDIDSHALDARRLAGATGARLVSVGYRLAPEYPFPAAVDDAVAAAIWLRDRAAQFGAAAGQIYLAGDSAGATLAIVAALSLGSNSGTGPLGVIALYPVLDFHALGSSPSYLSYGDGGTGLSLSDMQWFSRNYAADPSSRADWRCSPLYAPGLGALNRILIAYGAHDVLSSECSAFAQRLAEERIEHVELVLADANHGFVGTPELTPSALEALRQIGDWFKDGS